MEHNVDKKPAKSERIMHALCKLRRVMSGLRSSILHFQISFSCKIQMSAVCMVVCKSVYYCHRDHYYCEIKHCEPDCYVSSQD